MTYLYICAAVTLTLICLLLLACLATMVYDAIGIRAVKREINALPDVSEPEKASATACMEAALQADRKTRLCDLSAPLVMLLVLPFVSRSANQLLKPFRKWDNNISLNGDSGGVLLPDGRWLQWREMTDEQWKEVAEIGYLSVSYDDPKYRGDAYYAPGHNPRSFWARYVWVGLRNRASQLALDNGRDVKAPIEVLSGSIDIGTRKEGHFLLKSGDVYHFKSAKRLKLLGRDLVRIRNYGYKLEIAMKNADQADRVATVVIGWSVKRWKGGA